MGKLSRLLALAGFALLLVSFLPWPVAGQPAPAPTPEAAATGAALFRAKGCVSCHRHAAVDPQGPQIGPELTGYDGDPAFLRRWLQDPSAVRPGTTMPNLHLQPAEIEALIAFLAPGDETGASAPALDLAGLSAQARDLAQTEVAAPVLRQVVTDLHATAFLFTDSAATVEVDVRVPRPGAPLEEWELVTLSTGKLVGHRGRPLPLDRLRSGPRHVVEAMSAQWPGCTVRSLSLIAEKGALRWIGFCDTPAGTVSGSLEDATGTWRPSQAPPARPPAVATPAGHARTLSNASAAAPPALCPVTTPPREPFRPPQPYPATAPYDGQFWYGTEALWTALPADGRWDQFAHGDKLWWWRLGFDGREEPQPDLRVTGRRLDGPAPLARNEPPATNGYHPDFHWAMLTGFRVPTPGCWQVTGHYRAETLTFVVWVAP